MLNNQMARIQTGRTYYQTDPTIITAIYIPLTLIAGIFGMSEWTVMTGGEDNIRPSFLIFAGIMVIIGAVNFFFIKWLERRDLRRPR
jgi:magnesium transporter